MLIIRQWLLSAIALGVCATGAHAQAIPLATIEVAGGLGRHNSFAGNGENIVYSDNYEGSVRVAASLRLGPATRTALYLKADLSPGSNDKVELVLCIPSPARACVVQFSAGPTSMIGVGARSALSGVVSVGALVGLGEQGRRGNRESVRYAEADVMLRIAKHAGVIGAARYQRWHRQGEPYWYAPVTFGVQFF